MIKRYEVRWKSGGDYHRLANLYREFYTALGAANYAELLNNTMRDYYSVFGGPNVVAVVWDKKLDRQVKF